MAAGSVLKKITARAKHIRRIHGGTWKGAVKKAGAEYRAGRLGKVVTMHKKKRVVKKRKKVGRATGVLYKSSGKSLTAAAAAMGGRPHNGMIGGGGHSSDDGYFGDHFSTIGSPVGVGSIKKHLTRAKQIIALQIGREEMKKITAKTKTAKRKIAKKISKHRTQLRKLC